jgi:hypothetical protein
MKSWVTEDEGDEEEVAVVAAAVQGAVQVAALDASSKSSMLQVIQIVGITRCLHTNGSLPTPHTIQLCSNT